MPELPDNPYIAPTEKAQAFRSLIWSTVRLAMVTQRQAPEITFAYANTVLLHTPMYTSGDKLTALYAAHFELCAYIQNLLGVDAPVSIEFEPARCSSPECVVNHESEAVLIEAAARGDDLVIKNVCKATVAGAKDLDAVEGRAVTAEGALAYLFFGVLQRLYGHLAAQEFGHGNPHLN